MVQVFKNKHLEKKLREQGYVIISLLDNEDINALETFYYSETPPELLKFFTSFATNNTEYKKKVDKKLKEVIHAKAKNFFTDSYLPFWGNYMLKISGNNTEMLLHSDWKYVDEPDNISLNLWSPLTDTNSENGALWVVPYSHKVIDFPRGMNLVRYYEVGEDSVKKRFGKMLNLKKGEAVIYDHRVLHFSYPNLSGKDRLAVTLIYVPKNVPLNFYYFDCDEKKCFRYEIESEKCLLETNFFETVKQFNKRETIPHPDKLDYSIEKMLAKEHCFLRRVAESILQKF